MSLDGANGRHVTAGSDADLTPISTFIAISQLPAPFFAKPIIISPSHSSDWATCKPPTSNGRRPRLVRRAETSALGFASSVAINASRRSFFARTWPDRVLNALTTCELAGDHPRHRLHWEKDLRPIPKIGGGNLLNIVMWSAKHYSQSYVRPGSTLFEQLSLNPVQAIEEVKTLLRRGGCIFPATNE